MAYADLRGINPLQDITAKLHDAGGMGYSVKSQGALGFLGAQARGLARSVTGVGTTINTATVTSASASTADIGSYFVILNAGGAFLSGSSMPDAGYPAAGPAPHLYGKITGATNGVSWTINLNAGVTFASTTIYISTVNDLAAFITTAGKLQTLGGGELFIEPDIYFVEFSGGQIVTPYSNISTGGAALYLHGLNGVAVEGPGALIIDCTVYSDIVNGPGAAFLEIDTCQNVSVNIGCLCTQICQNFAGCLFVRIQGQTRNWSVVGEFQGGVFAIRVTNYGLGGVYQAGYGPRNGRVQTTNIGTVYPLLVEGKFVRGLEAHLVNIGAYRDFYLFGCSNVDLYCDSISQRGTAQIISDNLEGSVVKPCENIFVDYRIVQFTSILTGGQAALNFGFKGQTPGLLKNIIINFDFSQQVPTGDNSGLASPGVITLTKTNDAGANDSTGRGHVLDGFQLSGRIQDTVPAFVASPATYPMFSVQGAFASPDIIRNFRIKNLQLLTTIASGGSSYSGFYVDLGAALQDTAICDGLFSAGPMQVYATGAPGTWSILNCGNGANLLTNNGSGEYVGAGSPAGAVTAQPGSTYRNQSGGASTTLYVKESGANTTSGWVGK